MLTRRRMPTVVPIGARASTSEVSTLGLSAPVSALSLVAFRVVFGLAMLWEVYRYLTYDWVARYWVTPKFHFTYEGFHWLSPLPGDGMYYLFYGLGVLALMIALGLCYRLSTVLFFLGFAYLFLLEQTRYLNHFYLILLLSLLLIFLPAHRAWSLDAYWFPKLRRRRVATWTVWLLRFQLGVVYFFGGVAKLNADWLQGEPMRMWLAERTDFPLVGQWFTQEWMVYLFSYSGLLIDLLAVPLLMYRKTRLPMFIVLVLFHFTNDQLFSIGIFPWLAIGATTVFLAPSWPAEVYRRGRQFPGLTLTATLSGAYLALWCHGEVAGFPMLIGALVGVILATYAISPRLCPYDTNPTTSGLLRPVSSLGITLLIVWVSLQLAVPLRHYFIAGNVSWTEEGHRFAWHMKLRDKSGQVQFYTTNPTTGEKQVVDAQDYGLTARQWRKMSTRPYLIHQFAQHLSTYYPGQGIYALVTCSLNGRTPSLLIDPTVDLTQVDYQDWKSNDWILRQTASY